MIALLCPRREPSSKRATIVLIVSSTLDIRGLVNSSQKYVIAGIFFQLIVTFTCPMFRMSKKGLIGQVRVGSDLDLS